MNIKKKKGKGKKRRICLIGVKGIGKTTLMGTSGVIIKIK